MSIIMNTPIETDLSRPNDGYDRLLKYIRESFNNAIRNDVPLFLTNVENLYDIFLEGLPEDARQHYNCNECRRFVNNYGGLVTINEDGTINAAMWNFIPPDFFKKAVYRVETAVENAKVTGVFLTSERRFGVPKTGVWEHMSVDIPIYDHPIKHRKNHLFTAGQKVAEKKEDFKMLMNAVNKYDSVTVENAVNLLQSNSLYRSEKVLGIAEWFLELMYHKGHPKFTNLVWLKVATAPAGFCHISSSVIGSLLDDIEDGMDFDTVKRRFDEKMNPTKYQRPKAAPAAQNVARAEEIVAKLGIANSLKRRFARLDELKRLWVPKVDIMKPPYGVFGNVKTKEDLNQPKPLIGHGTTMTWDKFQRTVLPKAKKIEVKVGYGRDNYSALVTAADPEAPPIIQWDSEGIRNPFSWYLYSSGSYPDDWNLQPGNYVEVTGIVEQPNMWVPGYEHQGSAVFFILKGCKDLKNKSSALFPEVLRGELREVRATIEAYSNTTPLSGDWEADACGLRYQSGNDNWQCNIRVTTDVGTSLYKLDRWD